MLAFFPHPYPDELLFSTIARYHIWSGNEFAKTTLFELFGSKTPSAIVDLPSYIAALISNLPSGAHYTADDFINNHTLYPYYAPFLPEYRSMQIMQAMKNGNGGNIHTRAGIMANSVPFPTHLRFCLECLNEDIKQFGEGYWHRIHQVPGVFVCPTHQVLLHDSIVSTRYINKHTYIAASLETCQVNTPPATYDDRIMVEFHNLAKDCEWLLSNRQPSMGLEFFQSQYINFFHHQNLAIKGAYLDQQELVQNFIGHYGEKYLPLVYSDVEKNKDTNWLSTLFRKPRKATHPIRHLLVIRWLAGSVDRFFLQHKQEIDHKFRLNESKPNACPNKFINTNDGIERSNSKEQYRLKWTTIQEQFPYDSKTQIRMREPATYIWLYRHDQEWLTLNSPTRIQVKIENHRVDWSLRDEDIFQKAVEAVEFLLNTDKPVRITLSKIGRTIGHLGVLEKHIEKLNKTRTYIVNVCETVEEFQIRRVRWAANHIYESGQQVKSWQISRLAGLNKHVSDLVVSEIERQVNYYNAMVMHTLLNKFGKLNFFRQM